MDKFQAEKIVNNYGGAIADGEGVFRKQSTLTCSKTKIRYAFYVYIDAIINDKGCLPEKIGQDLVAAYSMLDSFIPDKEADRLNKIYEMFKSKQLNPENSEDKKQITEYFSLVTNAMRNGNYFDEINEFIDECLKEKSK